MKFHYGKAILKSGVISGQNVFLTKMQFRHFQETERQKILDFYCENFCKNLPLVKIFGGIPEDELRMNFEPTYGSMLEDGIYGSLFQI